MLRQFLECGKQGLLLQKHRRWIVGSLCETVVMMWFALEPPICAVGGEARLYEKRLAQLMGGGNKVVVGGWFVIWGMGAGLRGWVDWVVSICDHQKWGEG